tara:strand:+ start:1758 stop:1928 length:171 start_codon:yes stop_codon:yes gene_type:complete
MSERVGFRLWVVGSREWGIGSLQCSVDSDQFVVWVFWFVLRGLRELVVSGERLEVS